jgi:NAD(P)-dependent dehydrogenase (short-subunit alcohol dehydrogenase family)
MRALVAALLLLVCPPAGVSAQSQPHEDQKAVLVTGASTGIGRKITERLAAHGYFVYAGARKNADLVALNAMARVQAVRLDVTKPEEIDAAVKTVTQGGRGLYGLVNNAGIASAAPLIDMAPEEFDLTMNVNVYGPYRVTRAFAPLIVGAKGRIVNIGSIRGILSDTDLGAYQMSKHALESFSDVLAQELAPTGVSVSLVDPGSYNSEIEKNAALRAGRSVEGTERSMYKEPDDVAAAVELALFAPLPKRRYMVVPNQEQAALTINALLDQLVQLNEGQPYAYSRDKLVTLLDEALGRAGRQGSRH